MKRRPPHRPTPVSVGIEWAEAEEAFDQVMSSGNGAASEMLRAMRSFLNENDMMAYLTMMAIRLIEYYHANY